MDPTTSEEKYNEFLLPPWSVDIKTGVPAALLNQICFQNKILNVTLAWLKRSGYGWQELKYYWTTLANLINYTYRKYKPPARHSSRLRGHFCEVDVYKMLFATFKNFCRTDMKTQ